MPSISAIPAKKHILVIEDGPLLRRLLAQLLEQLNYSVTTAINGREGVKSYHSEQPDLVITDIFMPEMDGLEATRIIRGDGRMSNKAIIALTANAMPGDQDKFLEAGMDDYLSKPVTKYNLVKMLNKWASLQEE